MRDVLLPVRCPVCGRPGGAPCAACAAALRPAPHLPPPPGLDACAALLAYEGAGRELVARLKYRNARASLPGLAAAMAALAPAALVGVPAGPVAVTWAPTAAARRRRRGFDQGELLARRVARHLGLPCRRLLLRSPGPAQTGRSGAARRAGPPLRARRAVAGTVVVVDDVVTTGATLAAAASALRRAGAGAVVGLAAARVAPPGRAAPPADLHCGGSTTAARSVAPGPLAPASRTASGGRSAGPPPGEDGPWTSS